MPVSKTRRGDVLIPFLTVLCDAVTIEFSFLFSYWLRFRSSVFASFGFLDAGAPPVRGYWIGSLIIVLIWIALFHARKMYGARRSTNLSDELINIIRVVSLGMLVVMSAAFFYREFSYSRLVFGLLWLSSISFIFLGRVAVHSIERRLYRRGKNLKYAVIIGGEGLANEVYTHLDAHPSFGFNIFGYFADSPATGELTLSRAPYLGPITDAPTYLYHENVELAFIALRSQDHTRMLELIAACEGVNIEFLMVPDLLEILTSQMRVKELEGIPFVTIKSIPLTLWGRISKRMFDIVVSTVLLVLSAPLLLVIVIAIKLDSRGPLLFGQERVGLDGKRFMMYKFRSMKVGSEHFDDQVGLGMRNDPRRTRVGSILRKSSLDELPQLYNVLRGAMSLVGPRPERVRYVEEFRAAVPKYLDRHRVKTGMTGWAQVNGLRGDTSIAERIKYDLYYIENWSLAFDIKILLRTIRAAMTFHTVD